MEQSESVSGEEEQDVLDSSRETQAAILEGNVLLDHTPQLQTVRLFISCDPDDSVWEHGMVEHCLLGELKSHCASLGLHFQLVNPCYGATNDILERLELKEMCLREIKRCHKFTMGPNFLTLLSHHYGWKSLPRSISESDFSMFVKTLSIDDRPAYKILKVLYRLDTNEVPKAYCLHKNCLKTMSLKDCERLSRALRRAAKLAFSGKDKNKVLLYLVSTLEDEVIRGVFGCPEDPSRRCLWLKRTFTDLHMHTQRASDPALKVFCDVSIDASEVDFETQKILGHLKEARMTAKYKGLEPSSILEFPLKWFKGKGLDPQHDLNHASYLKRAFQSCVAALKDLISSSFEEYKATAGSDLFKEVLFHGHYCKEKAKEFKIHQDLLLKMQSYLNGPSQQPLFVCGRHGYGKTTLMAAAARFHKERYSHQNSCMILRFIGASVRTETITRTLSSICQQISLVYTGEELEPSQLHSYQSCLALFHHLLRSSPSEGRPLHVFLDGVDRISRQDGTEGLFWLPGDLPPHVKVVVSVASSSSCHSAARGLLGDSAEDSILEVPGLNNSTAQDLLLLSLGEHRRRLTKNQEEAVLQALSTCPSPLYHSLVLNRTLVELYHLDEIPALPSDEFAAVSEILAEVETKCGRVLTEKVASLVTLSRSGLTEAELVGLLSSDEEVVEAIRSTHPVFASSLDTRGPSLLPSFLWLRILNKLSPLLECCHGEGNTLVLNWRHCLIKDAARRRYLQDKESERKMYGLMVRYFSGKIPCNAAPIEAGIEYSQENLPDIVDPVLAQHAFEKCYYGDRKVPFVNQDFQSNENTLNHRSLVELPHALSGCGQVDELREFLCNLDWQLAMIKGFSPSDLVSEFNYAAPLVPCNRKESLDSFELRTVREALIKSTEVLSTSPELLPQVLVAWLVPIVKDTSASRPLIVGLCEQALDKIDSSNVLQHHSLPESTGRSQLAATLEGHRGTITGLVCKETTDPLTERHALHLLSSSCDGTVKSWDLSSGGVALTLLGHQGAVLCVDATESCTHAVSGGQDRAVIMWDLRLGCQCRKMEGHTRDVNVVVMADKGVKTISGSSDGTMKVWNTDLSSSFCGDLIYTIDNHQVSVMTLAVVKRGNLFACGDQSGVLSFWDVLSGEKTQNLTAFSSGSVSSVAVISTSREGELPKDKGSPCSIIVAAASSSDRRIKQFDFTSGRQLKWTECADRVTSICASDGVLINGTVSGCLDVRDAGSLSLISSLSTSPSSSSSPSPSTSPSPSPAVCSITASCLDSSGHLLFSASDGGRIRVWEL